MSSTLYVLYGSETGNAEQIAKDLSAQPVPEGFDSITCAPLEKFKKYADAWLDDAKKPYGLILISSTTGNADPPENASRFVRYIKRKGTADTQPFQNCVYAVLGLGDTNYDQFCAMGKLIDRKVHELGGTRVMPLACADEATGLEDVVEPWTATVLSKVAQAVKSGGVPEQSVLPESAAQPTEPAGTEPEVTSQPTKEISPTSTENSNEASNTAAPLVCEKSSSPLFIIYASETGNAEHIAKDLAETYEGMIKNPDVRTFFPSVVCCEMDQFKKKCVSTWELEPEPAGTKHGVIAITSTTGNGEAPENGNRFVRYIKRKNTADSQPFRHCAYTVLGLGDTNYDQFCNAGRIIDKKLGELGGKRAQPLACADEATGLEDVVDPWVDKVFYVITDACRGVAAVSVSASAAESIKPATPVPQEEEKKMDIDEPLTTTSREISLGVKMVRALLNLDATTQVEAADISTLPQTGSSRCKCEFIASPPTNKATNGNKTSVDEDGMHSLSHPFEASVLAARYLTNTSTDAATAICDLDQCKSMDGADSIIKCNSILDEQFPLSSSTTSSDAIERNGKRVIELTISLPGDDSLTFTPGDSIGLAVNNLPEASLFVSDMLRSNHSVQADQCLCIDSEHVMTVQDAVESYLDLCSPIKNKRTLCAFASFATDANDRCALHLLSSKTEKGNTLFQSLVVEHRLSPVELLRLFPSCQGITLQGLFGILPRIPPRYYSVCSSPLKSNTSLSVAFSVVDHVTPSILTCDEEELGKRRIHGVATRYLEAISSPFLCSGDTSRVPKLKIFPKPSEEFHLPADASTPLVLVGPGTGIAPFIGFLEQRQAMAKADGQETSPGSIDVYFGCRHANHDWLYKEEMEQLVNDGVISKLHTVFSRDNNDHRYVQDAMIHDSERLMDLILEKNAHVYICGDGNKMARDVQSVLAGLVGSRLGGGIEEGKAYVEQMKQDGKLLLDIWSG